MSITDDFKARFPEIADTTVDTYMPILEPAYPCYYGGGYTDCGVEIILNLLAHLMTIASASSPAGSSFQSSKSVGSVSVSQLTPGGDAWYNSTKYGQQYLALTKHNHGGCFV